MRGYRQTHIYQKELTQKILDNDIVDELNCEKK